MDNTIPQINSTEWMRISKHQTEIILILLQHIPNINWYDIFKPRYNYIQLKLSRERLNEEFYQAIYHPIKIMKFLQKYPDLDITDYMN